VTTGRRAIIVGAGIAGLAAALRLRQAGWEPVVLERAPARRRGGYALHLFGLGYDAAERMGILPALREREFGALELIVIEPDGRRRFSVPGAAIQAMFGWRNLNLLRSDFEAVLYEAVCDKVEIRFGSTIQSIAQDAGGVHVLLSDGTVANADVLIGADGRHSTVRKLMFGPEERFRRDLDQVIAAFIPQRPSKAVAEGSVALLRAPGRTMNILNLGRGHAAAFLAYTSTNPAAELVKGPQPALRRAFGDLGGVVADLLAQLDRSESVYFDTGSQLTVDRWSRGRVVLLGDAAWLVTVFAAYGASLAIGGADLLGTALHRRPDDIPAALAAWEAELRPEVAKRQRQGRRRARQQLATSRPQLLVRDLPLRLAALGPVSSLLQHRAQRRDAGARTLPDARDAGRT
jgi:2-polyprenyl-6-methoxyphenol hydroxylase-like FAD-dependent oxidoreductase